VKGFNNSKLRRRRVQKPMNSYLAGIINGGKPFAVRDTLYFEKTTPRMGFDKEGNHVQIGVYTQRVKAQVVKK